MKGTNAGRTFCNFFCLKPSICRVRTIFRSENGPKWSIGGPPIELAKYHSLDSNFLTELIKYCSNHLEILHTHL